MKVIEIIDINTNRKKIILDNEESFVLYKGELSKLHIDMDKDLEESDYNRIMTEILPKRAKLRGLNLIKNRPYTEQQMRQKYMDGGYPESVINSAIDYLKGMHFIDDYEFCRIFMTYKSASKSRKRIVCDLMAKGVKKDIIESAMNELEDNGDMVNEEELINRLIMKRHYNKEEASYEERQKMMSYLYGKGFSMDLIRSLT